MVISTKQKGEDNYAKTTQDGNHNKAWTTQTGDKIAQ
jgi:hypothetical protein